jgi:hypothetical protein
VSEPLRIVVLGYIVRCPLGGMAWHYLQYAMGLMDLGHDVYFLEDSDDYPSCYDPDRHVTDSDATYGLEFSKRVFDRTNLGDRWAYYDGHASRWYGLQERRVLDVCRTADVVLNISGANPLRSWLEKVPVRIFIDTDPVFEQIRQLTVPERRERALGHTAFFSFGENIEHPDSEIPDDGLPWRPTRQPVVLDTWPVTPVPRDAPFTTVMQWESYPAREYRRARYGLKAASFEPYMDLPSRTGAVLELALGTPTAPRALLRSRGWRLRDPLEVTRDPWTYQRYLQQSVGEFTVAKHGYVTARSGWFSERSAVYLASGRPVVIQETGFSDWMQTGSGVIPFDSPNEARDGIEDVLGRRAFHCRAARELAEEYFDSRKVLGRLLDSAAVEVSTRQRPADTRGDNGGQG